MELEKINKLEVNHKETLSENKKSENNSNSEKIDKKMESQKSPSVKDRSASFLGFFPAGGASPVTGTTPAAAPVAVRSPSPGEKLVDEVILIC